MRPLAFKLVPSEYFETSVLADEENIRGMTERKKE